MSLRSRHVAESASPVVSVVAVALVGGVEDAREREQGMIYLVAAVLTLAALFYALTIPRVLADVRRRER